MKRTVNSILVAIAVAGVAMLMMSRDDYLAAQKRNKILLEKTGRFQVKDPAKIHVRSVPTNKALHFEWLIYMPDLPEFAIAERVGYAGGSGGTRTLYNQSSLYGRLRLCFRKTEGRWFVWRNGIGGKHTMSFDERTLPDLSRLEISVLPGNDVTKINGPAFDLLVMRTKDEPGNKPTFLGRLSMGTSKKAVEDLIYDRNVERAE